MELRRPCSSWRVYIRFIFNGLISSTEVDVRMKLDFTIVVFVLLFFCVAYVLCRLVTFSRIASSSCPYKLKLVICYYYYFWDTTVKRV